MRPRRRLLIAAILVASGGACRAVLGVEDLGVRDGGADAFAEDGDAASANDGPSEARARCLRDCNEAHSTAAEAFYLEAGPHDCICDAACAVPCSDFCVQGTQSEPRCDDCAERVLVPPAGACHAYECVRGECLALADCLANCTSN